mmetsp:Transcript_22287/g.31158  ORF Transcript_22287/g.31158 Transcript_22287/m.31158 type:complete len:365 (-) Transcript_22287:234-1328(-)|eukprot:CAMPEP_0184487812 /NCGR_PEP_ID=MMETSP0113_2-20130426/10348_1 /TAXON_ID=91329 /ORGANISM="Norrisiella sphaerica, Strain BC52" /LENGTH=364 /DNA_ID=CAMNT_0026870221 /DNA_START=175 /DNA_END=1269 /DNA_ORIENTATION=+
MGLCTSSSDEDFNASNLDKSSGANTVLLLGPADAGKSTICKQLELKWGEGFKDEARKAYLNSMRARTLEYMQTLLCENTRLCGEEFTNKIDQSSIELNEAEKEMGNQVLKQTVYEEDINVLGGENNIGEIIEKLWKSSAITATYSLRHMFKEPLNGNADYFLCKAKAIGDIKYSPTNEDILRCRQRTVGSIECNFRFKDVPFTVYDLGGQWDERRNWIPFLKLAQCLVFVVDISAYDLNLREDAKRNCHEDAFELFERISCLKLCRESPIIIFFNKMDIFSQKIKQVPITSCSMFQGYDGDPDDEDKAVNYIADVYRAANTANTRRDFKHHFLCALDTKGVQKIFNSVMSSVLQSNLEAMGLTM